MTEPKRTGTNLERDHCDHAVHARNGAGVLPSMSGLGDAFDNASACGDGRERSSAGGNVEPRVD